MDDANPEQRPSRGRPRSRYAERSEQVKQNMRLYRARLAAEQAALGRALEGLLQAVSSGDLQSSFAAGAAVAGIWQESLMRSRFLGEGKNKSPKRRKNPDGSATGEA
ncbi:hypothetical protein [Azospira oryzae]|uniref:hypothetical protein n=1 Tax=Azospira oryzae TaxID=146939 RepID=UPI0019663612|nr:hypothetical protein [Azospira oryzae]